MTMASPPVNGTKSRYVDVGAYLYGVTDLADASARVQAALDTGYDREIVFTTPLTGVGRQRYNIATVASLILPTRCKLIMQATPQFNWGTARTGRAYFKATGSFSPAKPVNPAADILAGARTIPMASADHGIVRGDRIVLNTTAQLTPMESTPYNPANPQLTNIGEWCEVAAVSGANITTVERIRYSYIAADGTVNVYLGTNLCEIDVEGLEYIGTGLLDGTNTQGDRGLEVTNGDHLRIDGGDVIESDAYSVLATSVRDVRIDGLTATKSQDSPDQRTRYHIGLAGVIESAVITGCNASGGTEMVALTTTGGGTPDNPYGVRGLKSSVIVTGNLFSGAERSGVTTHYAYDMLNITNNTFRDCNQAADMRLGGIFNSNRVFRTGAGLGNLDCGVQFGAGMRGFSAAGNRISDVLRGYWLSPAIEHWRTPGDISIDDPAWRNIRGYGVLLDYDGGIGAALNADLGTVTIRADVELVSTGSPIAVQLQGRWTDVDIDLTVRGGSAAARTVFLTRPDSSASTTDGPIRPIIKTRRPAAVRPALVQYPAGGAGTVSISEQVFGVP